jgi:hypothetical protein
MITPMTSAAVTIYRMTQEIRQLKQTNAELLEALENVIARIEEANWGTDRFSGILNSDAIFNARRAIAKAKS